MICLIVLFRPLSEGPLRMRTPSEFIFLKSRRFIHNFLENAWTLGFWSRKVFELLSQYKRGNVSDRIGRQQHARPCRSSLQHGQTDWLLTYHCTVQVRVESSRLMKTDAELTVLQDIKNNNITLFPPYPLERVFPQQSRAYHCQDKWQIIIGSIRACALIFFSSSSLRI